MTRVVVHVDRLVLNGFRHGERDAVAAGLREELARVLADPDALRALQRVGSVASLRPGNVRVAHDASPRSVGAEAARSIARGTPR